MKLFIFLFLLGVVICVVITLVSNLLGAPPPDETIQTYQPGPAATIVLTKGRWLCEVNKAHDSTAATCSRIRR